MIPNFKKKKNAINQPKKEKGNYPSLLEKKIHA